MRFLPPFLVFILIFTACSGPSEDQAQSGSLPQSTGFIPDEKAIVANNRGVGLMGRFEYEPAGEVFSQLVETYPDWLDVKVNLAIAVLNRQQEGDELAALAMADDVLKLDPDHLRAHYIAGLLRLYLASLPEAQAHFRKVVEADPHDPYAAYYLAQCLAQQSEHEMALKWYRKALQLDRYLRSAYYGAFQSVQRLKRPLEARELIQDYQRLANNPRSRLAEFKYTRMGPKGEAQAVNRIEPQTFPLPKGALFSAPISLPIKEGANFSLRSREPDRPVSITAVDLQGDGRLDLFLSGILKGEGLSNLVLTAGEDNSFSADLGHPLARVDDVNSAVWGDYDNDGLIDVYLTRQGPNQLWRQENLGQWQDVTRITRTAGGNNDTLDGAFIDADHDGDLDLFLVNAEGPNELLNNNLDGSFRPLGAIRGIAGEGKTSHAIIPVDLDSDRDVDLVVLNASPPHEVYLNDRLWSYYVAPGLEKFRSTPALAAIASDIDTDGFPELYSLTPKGVLYRWKQDESGEFQSHQLLDTKASEIAWAQLAITDVNGDGNQEILVTTANEWIVVSGGESIFQAKPTAGTKLSGAIPLLLDSKSGPAVLASDQRGHLSLWPPGQGRHPFLSLHLSGKEDSAQSMRSNASGIGTQVSVRRDSHWSILQNHRRHSGPGQGIQPLVVGLGGAKRADFITIDWSDGVFQSELDLQAGSVHHIVETQRQLSSCPVLFAWDGEKFAFVSDLLGVGGMGYAVGPGEYAIPRPWEHFLLAPGLLQSNEGRYALKIAEPMEELAYLDRVRLVAYDLPPGWEMVLDERMGIQNPQPTGRPHYYQRELLPDKAINDRGGDVTEVLLHSDGRAAPVGELDRRFIGRLRSEHVLTLNFNEPLDSGGRAPILIIDGWVEYPYSQTMFAAWQASARFDAPTIEVQDVDGRWYSILEQFGYPAGMPRRMSVPLNKLPKGTSRLRIRTNMEIYWDRISVAFTEQSPQVQSQVLSLEKATQAKTGFALRTTANQRRPHYEYAQRKPFWDTRYMAGNYSRLGPVDELVDTLDDGLAIIGPGEEVHLEFAIPEEPAPRGWTRQFVLEIHGWAKDMDLYTKDGETVEPLPSSGKPAGRRDQLHARYHTRYLSGR